MNKPSYTNVFISTLLGSALVFGSGCQKQIIEPPAEDTNQQEYIIPEIPPLEEGNFTTNNGFEEGNLNTDNGFSEDNLPIGEGSLDDTNPDNLTGSQISVDEQSTEYLIMQGRSSKEMQPVYFSFDQTQISPSMQEIIFKNSRVMKNNPNISVVIEGNTDMTGTNEYNMALGERRALNVSRYLMSLGIASNRVRTISLGEERPLFNDGSDESARYNRRADFIIE